MAVVWKKILSREYGVQYTELSLRSLGPENAFIVPFPFYGQVYVPENGNQACYINESEWNAFVSALKEKYLDKPENYGEFERLFMETGGDYAAVAKKIAETPLADSSNAELKQIYLDYQAKNLRYAPFIWIQFIINNFFAEMAKEIISSRITANEDFHSFIEVALKPDKKASSIRLNDIAAGWGSMDESEKDEAYEKFKWVPCLDIHNKSWAREEFFSHISDFKIDANTSNISYESMIERVNPSEEEKHPLAIAKRLSYLKDLKDDFRRQGVFYGQNLFREMAGRMGLTLEDMSYLLEPEIVEFLDNGNKVPLSMVSERKKGFVIYFAQDKNIECRSGDSVKTVLDRLGIAIDEKVSSEIKGMPASLGRAKGVVKIIRGVADLSKVKKGDILVAVSTHPDYIVAMQKAVAIITDEGGITSHAAIVSREMGIPCIVGTKNATRSLKDGDAVEVDAKAGTVRKIRP